MTFLEGLGLGESEVAELSRSQLASLVRQGIGEGLSGNEMLRQLTAAGSGIRRQSFLQLVGEVKDATARAGELADQPLGNVLSEENYVQWTGGQANTYLHRVSLFVRESEEGELGVITKDFDIQSPTRLSPSEAVSRAVEIFTDNTGSENYPSEELLGAELRGAYHQLGAA